MRNRGRQTGQEIHGFEGHLRRSVPVGDLQGVDNIAGGTERQTRDSYRGADDVATQALPFISLTAFAAR